MEDWARCRLHGAEGLSIREIDALDGWVPQYRSFGGAF